MAEETEEVVEATPLTQILATKVEATDDVKPEKSAESPSDSKDQKPDAEKPTEKPEGDEVKPDQSKGELADITKELKGLKKALRSERDKRQAAEQREEIPRTSWDEDPDQALEERLAEQTQTTENRFYLLCENLVKAEHSDFDEVVKVFMEEAEDDPALAGQVYQQMSSDANPAQYLYNYAKNRSEMAETGGDLTKYRESIEAPLNVKVSELEKANKELTEQLGALGKLTPSLNKESSAAKATVDDESANEPTPMDDIVGPRKRA